MIEKLQFTCEAEDGLKIACRSWRVSSVPPQAVLLIIHGITEFCWRYDDFATFLSEQGVLVYSFDLRGHGLTTQDAENRGFFAKRNGVDLLVSDINCVRAKIEEIRVGIGASSLPFFILGHSMGAMITSCYIRRNHAKGLSGVIISSIYSSSRVLAVSGVFLARLQCLFRGPKSEAKLLMELGSAGFNKKIRPQRTPKDWLTRDEAIVDKYIADPACMFNFKAAGLADFSPLVIESGFRNWTQTVPTDVPVYIYCGDMDPAGLYTKGPRRLYQWFRDTGHSEAVLKVYPGGRHEMHNELNRDEVYRDVHAFILLHSQLS